MESRPVKHPKVSFLFPRVKDGDQVRMEGLAYLIRMISLGDFMHMH